MLISKLRWETQELEVTSSVDHATQLCSLIKECTDVLRSTRELSLHDLQWSKFPFGVMNKKALPGMNVINTLHCILFIHNTV